MRRFTQIRSEKVAKRRTRDAERSRLCGIIRPNGMNDKAKMAIGRAEVSEEREKSEPLFKLWKCGAKKTTTTRNRKTHFALLSGSAYSFNPGGWIDGFCFGQNKCHITHAFTGQQQ